jgi:hypothetical protein
VPTIGDLTAPGWLAGGPMRRERRRGAAAVRPAERAAGRGRRQLALDDDLAVAVLDLDLAEVVLVEQLGELAHQIGVDPHAARSASPSFVAHLFFSLFGEAPNRGFLSETGRRVQSKLIAERAETGDRAPGGGRDQARRRKLSRACGLDRWTSITGTGSP